jgi:hypothetical protein
LVTSFFNPIYAWLDSFGSLSTVMATFSELSTKNAALAQNQSAGQSLLGLVASPYLVGAAIFYYGSLIMLAFLTAFLKIAVVMVFGVAFIWGLIAIPISISTTFKILRGWAYLTAFALVWPVIQALLLGMFTMLFTNSVNQLVALPDNNAQILAANAMMLFSVMHLLMGAVMVAAPFIANSLVTNSSSAAGIVMPFVGAAIAAGTGTAKATSGSSTAGRNWLQKDPAANSSGSGTRNNLSAGPKPRSVASTPSSAGPVANSGMKNSFAGDTSASEAPAVPLSSEAPDVNKKKVQQQRRGVIIRQQAKTPR